MRVLTTGSAAALMFILAACGGGAAGTAQPTDDGAQATAGPTDAGAPTDPGAPTDGSPTESQGTAPEPTTGGGDGSGGFASHPCDLVSQADAEAAAAVTGLTSSELAVDPMSGICSWRDANGQVEVYAGVWVGDGGTGQWEAIKYLEENSTDVVEKVDGLGGDAMYSTQGDVLLVHKGDTLVQITVRSPGLDAAALKAAAFDVGKAVLARL